MKHSNRYDVVIEHSEWGHSVCSYPTKKEAVKRAVYVKRHGCFFSDELSKNDREKSVIMIYDSKEAKDVYIQPFTTRYINFGK